jgi:hypothetical protein
MVAAVGVRTSQGKVLALADGPAVNLRVETGKVLAAAAYPAENARVTQASVLTSMTVSNTVRVTQAKILAVGVGRVFDPKVRVFTFTIDGHDYVVIRLGTTETLVYDNHSDQFYIWGSGSEGLWKAYDGVNWPGGARLANSFGSNVVVGDDANGSLYFLDPNADQDDDAVYGSEVPREFRREVSGQYPLKGYSFQRCYGVELYGSIGQSSYGGTDQSVTLSYSDDRGTTYVNTAPITINVGDYNGRVFWRSLGSIRTPGRIFKITDYGTLKRIDGMNMLAEGEGKT